MAVKRARSTGAAVKRARSTGAADRPQPSAAKSKSKTEHRLEIPSSLTVNQLSQLLGLSVVEVIKQLMRNGVMASINQVIDYDTAATVATDFGHEAQEKPRSAPAEAMASHQRFLEEDAALLQPRPPVVTIMGHVDHGKTSLLDAIRQTNVIATEVGGITQHIGAYQVEIDGRKITFLDTPGHEAFTAMRARGAQVTDIAILVVAADDGAMPQTVEAIDHARAAGVPIVVAINKIDKPEANPERAKQQLADLGLLIEEWGGDVVCVPVSAKKKQGISDLLENLLVVAEVAELKANPHRPAVGAVIEAGMDKTKGPLATVLIHTGTLKLSDTVSVGDTWGRVKAMFNEKGKRVKQAGPATPVAVLGLNSVPQAGDTLLAVADERKARAMWQERQAAKQQLAQAPGKLMSLDNLYTQLSAGAVKGLNVVLKTDVQGSIEPIRDSLERLGTDKARVRVIHSGSGGITESDVLLTIASKGIVIGFGTRPEPGARRIADLERVDIRYYDVIYNLVDDVERALEGLLEPTYVEVIEGHAEIRAIFTMGKKGKVAGTYVTDGKVSRGAQARILRQGESIYESKVSSLRRFKEDVTEVATGFECGVGLEGRSEFEVGDIIELYRKERSS